MAPLIDNNIFPVPVNHYIDLISEDKRPRARLRIPVRLTISNSKRRRLLVLYTTRVDEKIEFGRSLDSIRQGYIR